MKDNVDLTENQIFSRKSPFEDMALGVLTLRIITGSKFPWDIGDFRQIRSDDEFDIEHQRVSLIALGDKKKRAEIAEYRKMDSLDYCDCCGARMNLKPWHMEMGVCHKCNEYYEGKGKDKCLWRKKEEIISAVIRTV